MYSFVHFLLVEQIVQPKGESQLRLMAVELVSEACLDRVQAMRERAPVYAELAGSRGDVAISLKVHMQGLSQCRAAILLAIKPREVLLNQCSAPVGVF